MSWFSKLMGGAKATPAPEPEHEPAVMQGQIRMTLEERIAFRRKMVLETVQEALLVQGLTEKRFHMSVARMDERGHQYAVMIDLFPDVSGQPEMSPQEWLNMEQRIAQLVMSRYRIKVTHVYWRFDSVPTAATTPAQMVRQPLVPPPVQAPPEPAVAYAALNVHPNRQASTSSDSASGLVQIPVAPLSAAAKATAAVLSNKALGSRPIPTAPLSAAAKISAAVLSGSLSKPRSETDDGFPATQIQESNNFLDDVSADELRAFEEAIRQGHDADRPLKLGKRTYQTDFMPLE